MTTARPTPDSTADTDALFALALGEHRAGRLAEAVAALQKLLSQRPDNTEARNNLGTIRWQQGQLEEAARCYEQAIALRPDYADAYSNLGTVLLCLGRLDAAAERFEQALTLRPDNAEACNNLGVVLWQQGKLHQAVARYEQGIALRRDNADAYGNLGAVLLSLGRLDEARQRLEQSLSQRPDNAEAHNNLGIVLRKQGQLDEAHARFEQALALRPNYAEAHNNLGNVLKEQGQIDQALARVEQALALRPNYAEAHNNLGVILWQQGRLDEAAARYEQALALKPDLAEAQMGRAARYLVEGDYERGWPEYEVRLRVPGHLPRHNLPRWAGEPLAGRSLLLLAEQGVGDTIQFVRYARLLKERGARVVLACQKALGGLLAGRADWDELFVLGSAPELPRTDFYLPLLSAPLALGTNAATIPGDVPYLAADPALVDAWRAELAGVGGFKIGIVWQGSRKYHLDRWRSIPLAHFAPLAKLPGVRLISLQKGFGSEQIATVDFPVLDLSDRLDEAAGPMMDTAAVIRNLDLVLSPDTAIAHLAGALAAPVWLALQLSPDWRWLRRRDDTPWYPTMRLFRQTTLGAWPEVFERIASAIEASRSQSASSA
ncbi:MAG TPA: tetratricopeptide repeat protein [Pirellulales bacterium]|jgi:Tfp pilus assembly protein PilF|nr:tetratricopeptide repeat protein [Pirellulales bacterium]